MNVTRFEPWNMINLLHRDLETGAARRSALSGYDDNGTSVADWLPAVDIIEEREQFVKKVAESLLDDSLWLSISGSCDGPEYGPPRRSAIEITNAVEPYFEILYLNATELDELTSEELEALGLPPGTTPKAWECLMRKRSATASV